MSELGAMHQIGLVEFDHRAIGDLALPAGEGESFDDPDGRVRRRGSAS